MKRIWGWFVTIDEEELVLTGVGVVVLIVICAGIVMLGRERAAWQTFVEEHRCVVVEKRPGQRVVGFSSGGQVVSGASSDQTAYRCNDGVIYWRND